MNFKQFPLIHEVLIEENLKPIDVIDDKLVCVDESGSKYVLKECRGVEDVVFKVDPMSRTSFRLN